MYRAYCERSEVRMENDFPEPTSAVPLPRRRARGATRAGRARQRACERRVAAAGGRVPAEPTVPRLN